MKGTVSVILVFLAVNAPAAEDAGCATGDLARVQGKWTAKVGVRHEIHVVMDIRGRDVSVEIKTPQGLDFQVQGEVKLDETTTPRSLDWKKFSGPDQQPLPDIAAVYKIDGDTFTVRNGGLLGRRPKEFKPGDGVLNDLVVFHRPLAKDTGQGAVGTATKSVGASSDYEKGDTDLATLRVIKLETTGKP